ncbi:Bacterial microcompartments protein family [Synechococcus sp. PCC 7335]|uniref:carbon dioxide-concentrating mechanism protein CcmK n=1 Tax=Synechococcus sp. (strain ATCC 29403 / PCC 7335) TaxID=91464 RepID=UPI00017EB128|nr:carbon dioxide-concentrating mechanism protein CcmK [Synechococcus sp. PCC 7335]EDX87438.1 Bacterial microcompartments protein family [Synechococcus sp. PCC 7335]
MRSDATPSPQNQATRITAKRRNPLRDTALGMVSTTSFPAIIGIADAMIKSSNVFLVGYEKTGGGHCTAIVRGGVADIRMAVHAGERMAKEFGQFVSSSMIPRPPANLEAVLPLLPRIEDLEGAGSLMGGEAIGLLETRGFPAMVGAADAMTKSAEITLISHETIGGGLCTIIIQGSLSNVAIAVEAGMNEAERIGELNSVMVIPRPLSALERSLPKTKKVETQVPLKLPLKLEEKQQLEERQKELVPAKNEELEPLKRQAVVIPELETEEL